VPLISVGEIREGFLIITDETPRVPEAVVRRLPQYVLRKGDIVFGRKGGVDRSALIRQPEHGWFLGSDGISVRPSQDCHDEYLAAQFQSARVQGWLIQHAIGTTMPSLNQDILRKISIPFPPTKAEQETIAEALSDADSLIGSLEKLLAKKRHLKQGATEELLTGKKRLPGFNGEWEVKQLGELAAFHKGKGLPKSALDPFGAVACIHYGELFTRYPETIQEINSRTHNSADSFRSVANDVLMPTSDVTPNGLAKASCVSVGGVILGGDILVIRSDVKQIFGSFLSYVIRQAEDQILQLVTGTTVFHLYAADMKKFSFFMPSMAEQRAIVAVLDDMDAEIATLEARLAKVRQLKQGMMQELLTGRVRLI
jgi:type I restriction enzyme, S subunit